jgi:very-short-patch-repair endonuclease
MNTRHRIKPTILKLAREMRHPQTAAEIKLWRALRARNLGPKVRRQHPIRNFIVDFYCAQARLCIEIDGPSHLETEQAEYDAERTAFLEEFGYHVIRFSNEDVSRDIHSVVDEIIRVIGELQHSPG